MKICISSTSNTENCQADSRFGRCSYFAIYDTENNTFNFIENKGVSSSQGAGIAASQQIIDEHVEVVITGHLGPNAMKMLNAANIQTYEIKDETVENAVKIFMDGKLSSIDKPVDSHFGMQK